MMQVMILEKSGDGWWRGQYGNKVAFDQNLLEVFLKSASLTHSQVGWFPSNYTQEEIDDPHTYCMAENVLDVMVKLHRGNHLQCGIISCCCPFCFDK